MRFRVRSSVFHGVLAVLLLTLLAPAASGASVFGPNVRVNDDPGIAVQKHVAASQTVQVLANQLMEVVGHYTFDGTSPGEDPTTYGRLRVTTGIDDTGDGVADRLGVWTQVIVDGVPRDGWGLNWLKIAPGPYVVTFSDVPNLGTPAPMTVQVAAGDNSATVYVGVFKAHGGLKIESSPPVPGTIFVDGVPRNDWGMWQSMPPGTYKVSFGPVPGHATPPTQIAIVKANDLTRIVGPYTVIAVASAQTVIVTAGATTLVKGDYVAASPSVLTASASGGIVALPPGPASASVDVGASVGILAAATLRTPASRIED